MIVQPAWRESGLPTVPVASFKKRLDEKRIDEAKKIFLALKRMLPSVDDPDQKAEGFLQYAASCLIKESSAISAGQEKDSSNSCDSCSEEKSHLCSLNAPQQKVLDHIRSHPGVSVPKLNAELGIPSKSIERHIASLTKNTLIGHRGSKKTGGYYPL